VAADLRGDLLGAEADLTHAGVRWLSPLSLWTGIAAGPIAWALDLGISYALVKWTCGSQRNSVLHLVTAMALAITVVGAAVAWLSLQQTVTDIPSDGGHPRQRAHFMALLGLASSALFAVTIVAGAIPRWMLDACQ